MHRTSLSRLNNGSIWLEQIRFSTHLPVLRATPLDMIMSSQVEHGRLYSGDMAMLEECCWRQWIVRLKRGPGPPESLDIWVTHVYLLPPPDVEGYSVRHPRGAVHLVLIPVPFTLEIENSSYSNSKT